MTMTNCLQNYLPGHFPDNQDTSSICVLAGAIITMFWEPNGRSKHAGCQATVVMENGDKLREALCVSLVDVIVIPGTKTISEVRMLVQLPKDMRHRLSKTDYNISTSKEMNAGWATGKFINSPNCTRTAIFNF